MQIKLLLAGCICASSFLLGREYARSLRSELRLIESFINLTRLLISHLEFTNGSMTEVFKRQGGKIPYCAHLAKGDNEKYKPDSQAEKECIKIIEPALKDAEQTSDAVLIADLLRDAQTRLKLLYENTEREKMPVIKTAPVMSLTVGVFIAAIII